MPRGIPKSRANITKMEGVRRALAELGKAATPREIEEFLQSRFGIKMEPILISKYKSSLKARKRRGMIRRTESPTTAPLVAEAPTAGDGITLEDIRAVKEVVDKVGADKVRQLAEVLGK